MHGIGLGLVISKQIVEQFGGNIYMTSTYGEGTTFTFVLVLHQESLNLNQIEIEDKD